MKFADRLKFTATGTSAATITFGAAVTACRTLAQAITDGALTVGDTGVPFTVTDGTNWEDSLFTVTSTTQLTRTSVLSSSAGGTIPVTFTGPLTVFNASPASFLNNLLGTANGVTVNTLNAATLAGGMYLLVTDSNGNAFQTTIDNLKTFLGISGTPAETLTVNNPGTQTANTAFSVSGTYANVTPTALDWSINGGSSWNAAASPTISGGTFSFSGVTVPSANASQTIMVRDHTNTSITATSASFVVNATATQTITVNTPATQTVGTAFNVTGTYANGTPTALDYRLSDDPAGQWTQVATATISGGTFSFSVTPSSASAGRTISVRDRTTGISGTSGTYVVNAATQTNAQKYNQIAAASFTPMPATTAFSGGTAPNQYFSVDLKVSVKASDNSYPAAGALVFFWLRVPHGAAAPTTLPTNLQFTAGAWPSSVPYNANGGTGDNTVTVPNSVKGSAYFDQTNYPGVFTRSNSASLFGGGATGDYYYVVGFPDGSFGIVPTPTWVS
jgi:hypothetical protein